jgi:hypothetical protein
MIRKKRKRGRPKKDRVVATKRQQTIENAKVRRGNQLDFTVMEAGETASFDLNGTIGKGEIVICRVCGRSGMASRIVNGWVIHRANLRPNYSGRVQFNPTVTCI